MNDALMHFKSWRDSAALLRVTLAEEGNTVISPCRIVVVGDTSLFASATADAHTFEVRRLDDADFDLSGDPLGTVLELSWDDGRACRFELLKAA